MNFENKHKQKLESKELINEIQRAVQALHGDFGCAAIRRGLSGRPTSKLSLGRNNFYPMIISNYVT